MAETRAKFAARVVGEVGIIILGVLIAFQADRWAQDREAQARAAVLLDELRADLEADHGTLEGLVTGQRQLLIRQAQLLRIIHGTDPRPAADSIAFLFTEARRFNRFTPTSGAYDALVASGDLRLIGSSHLRRDLATYFARAKAGFEDEDLSTLYRSDFSAAVVAETDFLALVPLDFREGLVGSGDAILQSKWPPDIDALLSSPDVSSYLTLLNWVERGQQVYFGGLEDFSEHVLEVVDEEVASR